MAMEVKVLIFEMVIEVAWVEASQAIAQYKISVEFEDEVSEAIYGTFIRTSKNATRKWH